MKLELTHKYKIDDVFYSNKSEPIIKYVILKCIILEREYTHNYKNKYELGYYVLKFVNNKKLTKKNVSEKTLDKLRGEND